MALYDSSSIYILSGTGNTFRIACWIEDIFTKGGIDTSLEMIENADLKKSFPSSGRHLTGFLFPTHGFMPPWSMIKFLFKLPRVKNAPAFAAASRGALKIGKIKIPGAAGFATFFAAFLLAFKGYDVKGFFSLDMISNFINFHSGFKPAAHINS